MWYRNVIKKIYFKLNIWKILYMRSCERHIARINYVKLNTDGKCLAGRQNLKNLIKSFRIFLPMFSLTVSHVFETSSLAFNTRNTIKGWKKDASNLHRLYFYLFLLFTFAASYNLVPVMRVKREKEDGKSFAWATGARLCSRFYAKIHLLSGTHCLWMRKLWNRE